MSGGHYDYKCFEIRDFADLIETSIYNEEGTKKNSVAYRKEFKKFMEEIGDLCYTLEWVDSGDTGEDTFLEKWTSFKNKWGKKFK